jgi:predicted ATP-dependent endonuclease of OLD family
MRIAFAEIGNFRKLKSVRIDFGPETTVLVGANNSGKTSAMVALGHFLSDPSRFSTNDFTLSDWDAINAIGNTWRSEQASAAPISDSLGLWKGVLPFLDCWLSAGAQDLQYVSHLLADLSWAGGLIGVRLRLEPTDIPALSAEFLKAAKAAETTIKKAQDASGNAGLTASLWPRNMRDFLDRKLLSHFRVRAYALDPALVKSPKDGIANPQVLDEDAVSLGEDVLSSLIQIDEIAAQRGFGGARRRRKSQESGSSDLVDSQRLSDQLRSYYAKHLDPSEFPEPQDIDALKAIEAAQTSFDDKLKKSFEAALKEVESLGYPGVTDPRILIATRVLPSDGLKHDTAVQYEVPADPLALIPLRLPEEYNGLGYQNLISIVFRLMAFRDSWMKVGKAANRARAGDSQSHEQPPIHLVLVEEPEAHLHVQVQQVFIRRAYQVLRSHPDLGSATQFVTQLLVSTHSAHIAHETPFENLRYFRRRPASGGVPTSQVVNLSSVFGTQDDTARFVARYLRSTHCDLFFADAAILVEGPAERILVPYFIRHHHPALNKRFLTILEVGGSHAHRFRPLLEHLGLDTLVITDLDAAEPTGHHKAAVPKLGAGLVSRNSTLKSWVPKYEALDDLASVGSDQKVVPLSPPATVRAAYQCPVKIDNKGAIETAFPNTFEDALVHENRALLDQLSASGVLGKVIKLVQAHPTSDALASAMFEFLKSASKGEFAMDVLFLEEPSKLKVPTYIAEGLEWLEKKVVSNDAQLNATTRPAPQAAAATASIG